MSWTMKSLPSTVVKVILSALPLPPALQQKCVDPLLPIAQRLHEGLVSSRLVALPGSLYGPLIVTADVDDGSLMSPLVALPGFHRRTVLVNIDDSAALAGLIRTVSRPGYGLTRRTRPSSAVGTKPSTL
eukprot:6465093-Amphidinium_carterae.1